MKTHASIKYCLLLIGFILLIHNNCAQPTLIKDNLDGPKDGCPALNPVDELVLAYKSKIYFCGTNRFADLSAEGDYEPWTYDPANNNLSIMAQLIPFKGSVPNKFFVSGDKFYFGARDEFSLTDKLYVSEGTNANTINLCDSSVNGLRGMLVNPSRNTIVPFKNGAIFNAFESQSTFSVWFTNGTKQGTIKLNAKGFADNFVVHPIHQVALFTQDNQYIISDGTIAGTRALNDLIAVFDINAVSIGLGVLGNNFIMEALDPNTGSFGLFVSTGITNQYTKLIEYGGSQGKTRNLISLDSSKCVFSTKTGIYITDGTKVGTFQLPGLVAYNLNNQYSDLWTVLNGRVYFAATNINNNQGVELYSTDGTIAGTNLVLDINSNGSSNPSNLKVHNGYLYFTANNGVQGNELWYTNGTYTESISDINPGPLDSNPMYLTGLENNLYFSANNINTGRELYKFNINKLSIENISSQNHFVIYPTINSGEFLLSISDFSKISSLRILNNSGALIGEINQPTQQINLRAFNISSGLYFIQLINKEDVIDTQKIIIQE